jgi:uncharacterized protein (DUF2236 family)
VKSRAISPRELPGILPSNDVHPQLSPTRSGDETTMARGMVYMLQREVLLLVAWGPAILLQFAHPLVARGIADHSAFNTERWGRAQRLHRTLRAMLQLSFGTESEVHAAAVRINTIHDRIHGRLSQAAGIFPEGTAYSAHDPALLAWVHATLLEMNLRVYELFVASLSAEAKDRYCLEASSIEGLLGIPNGYLPRNVGELRQYMDRMYASGEVCVTDIARSLSRALMYPPVPWIFDPAIRFMRLTTFGLLPTNIRSDYGFFWSARHDSILRLLSALSRIVLPLIPPVLRYWPAAYPASGSRCPLRMCLGGGSTRADRSWRSQARCLLPL